MDKYCACGNIVDSQENSEVCDFCVLHKCIKDELGGVHEEGLGWHPNGIFFCGECSAITCVGCPHVEEENILWTLEVPDAAISETGKTIDLRQCSMNFKDKR